MSDSRGIVKLKSECIIDFKKKIAEITLITTRIIPGSIYLLEKKLPLIRSIMGTIL